MADEAPLTTPIEGVSGSAAEYPVALNLKTRLFRDKRSPLVDSTMFRSLPKQLQENIVKRLQKYFAPR